MRGTTWLTAAAIAVAVATFGCDREASVPEPTIPEKARLPAINDRIEREADEGTRPGTAPMTEPSREGQPRLDQETAR